MLKTYFLKMMLTLNLFKMERVSMSIILVLAAMASAEYA